MESLHAKIGFKMLRGSSIDEIQQKAANHFSNIQRYSRTAWADWSLFGQTGFNQPKGVIVPTELYSNCWIFNAENMG